MFLILEWHSLVEVPFLKIPTAELPFFFFFYSFIPLFLFSIFFIVYPLGTRLDVLCSGLISASSPSYSLVSTISRV